MFLFKTILALQQQQKLIGEKPSVGDGVVIALVASDPFLVVSTGFVVTSYMKTNITEQSL